MPEAPSRDMFHQAYSSAPPWDVGHPQPVFSKLAATDIVKSPVLDVGCGTGEHALLFASRGHEVVGVDIVPRAIELAREKARERGLTVDLRIFDALDLGSLETTFETVIDSGVFHVFDDTDRKRYVASLSRALRSGGRCYLLAFSDSEPGERGPRRIRREEIEAAFAEGFSIHSIVAEKFETRFHEHGAHAWFATIERI